MNDQPRYGHEYNDIAKDVIAFQRGEITFNKFLNRNEWMIAWLHFHCWRLLKNEHSAEDAANDILLKVYLKLAQLRMPLTFKSWLGTVTYRHCWRVNKLKHNDPMIATNKVPESVGREAEPSFVAAMNEEVAGSCYYFSPHGQLELLRKMLAKGHKAIKYKTPKLSKYANSLGMPSGPRREYALVADELGVKVKNLRADFSKYKKAMKDYLTNQSIGDQDVALALNIMINGEPDFDN